MASIVNVEREVPSLGLFRDETEIAATKNKGRVTKERCALVALDALVITGTLPANHRIAVFE